MGETLRWLHLSDFHVGKDDYAGRRMFEYVLNHVEERRAAGFTPDLVFVSGDLADRGLDEEHSQFWLDFALPLVDLLNLDSTNRLFVVPGNHDVDRTKNPAFDRAEMAEAGSAYFDPTSEGRALRQWLLPRFSSFVRNDLTSRAEGFEGDLGSFSAVVQVKGYDIGIAGINTAWLSKDEVDKEELTPGKPLLEASLSALENCDLRIVLGHHPINWMLPKWQPAVRSLLAKHAAIYLHGHLHFAWAEPTYGGGAEFLTIQAGAAFQAREGERWLNGFVWAEVDIDEGKLKLQPRHWSTDHQDWVLASDAYPEVLRDSEWWQYPIPGSPEARRLGQDPRLVKDAPPGWEIVSRETLNPDSESIEDSAATRFFDGALPTWEVVLSSLIPRRDVVASVVKTLGGARAANRPIVTLLLAPACEGKSTALLQAACEVAKPRDEWCVLRRVDDACALAQDALSSIVKGERRWLIVIDEADRVAGDLVEFLAALPGDARPRVHALIACRDSDWIESGAGDLEWSAVCDFHQERVPSLTLDEAEKLVEAWSAFGDEGLADLVAVPAEQRPGTLYSYCEDALARSSEAFFGALLRARHGADLEGHARVLIERVRGRKIASGGTLGDALSYIAAMHSHGLPFLSRPVLARVLGCPAERLHRDVLARLGHEAAATSTSTFIFTRHQEIAQAIEVLLERDFAEDIDRLFIELAEAAITEFVQGGFVPQLAGWRYTLPDHFVAIGRTDLAIGVGEVVFAHEPYNSMTLLKLTSLHREHGEPTRALQLFRAIEVDNPGRAFYHEWAVCESAADNQAAAVALEAYSLSDQCTESWLSVDSAAKQLAALGVQLGVLVAAYRDEALRKARAAVAVIGLTLQFDEEHRAWFSTYLDEATADGSAAPELEDAVDLLAAGLRVVDAIRGGSLEVDEAGGLAIRELTFGGLARLVGVRSR
jgi:hypothetical protein